MNNARDISNDCNDSVSGIGQESSDPLSERFLKSDWLEEYRAQIEVLWHHSARLHGNLHLLSKISEFPFDLFGDGQDLCWILISRALYETSVMTTWCIVFDSDGNALTMRQFRNAVVTSAKDLEAKDRIIERLRKVDFDSRVSDTEEKVKALRHGQLAHLDRDIAMGAQEERAAMFGVSLQELQSTASAVHELISALSFDSGRAPTYFDYDNVTGLKRDEGARILPPI